MTADTAQLIRDTCKGNDAAAKELWRRLAPRLLAYARAIVGSSAAEDVVQTVFVGLLVQPRRTLDTIADGDAYLVVAVRRTAITHLRAQRRRRAHESAGRWTHLKLPRPPDRDGSVDPVSTAIARLPRRLREVLVLKHHTSLTLDQVAAALGLNRNTAAARYRRAMERLREDLALSPTAEHARSAR